MDKDPCTCPTLHVVYDELLALSGQFVRVGYVCLLCEHLIDLTWDEEPETR